MTVVRWRVAAHLPEVATVAGMNMALLAALKPVVDPEIGLSIVDLGLVRNVDVDADGRATVVYTLTSMGCPLAELIEQQMVVHLLAVDGVDDVTCEVTFHPPWSTDDLSDDARDHLVALGMPV